jgi:ACS family sodium-dependent inorganic phosphate cotransporter
LILSSFYWGYVLTHLPGGIVAEKYGGKHTLGFGILLTSVFTVLTPIAVNWGDSIALIILRILMGLGEGTTYPAINVLLAQWTPPEERSRTASFVYAGALIGTIFATTVSGWILQYSQIGWPLVFYVMGTIGIIWFLIWLPACYNSPRDHPFISEKEVNYLIFSILI